MDKLHPSVQQKGGVLNNFWQSGDQIWARRSVARALTAGRKPSSGLAQRLLDLCCALEQ
jgi:hypothetical protein